MIKPLSLGKTTFPVNLIQGPLAGVSCAPFRLLTWRYSQPAFSCTEMISCKTLIYQPALSHRRFVLKDPQEGPVCFQLAASEPHEVAAAAKIVTDHGADLIDLNCGCPVKKIRSKGAGSSLLQSPATLYQLITALKNNTHVPISIKIRVDGASDEKFNQEVARVVREAGADFLVVHGRHWTERYDTSCHYDDIRFFVEALNIPVIGNGDVACVNSLKKMLATGCAGVMVSRAGVGQPWLIGQLAAQYREKEFVVPSLKEVGDIFVEHLVRLIELLNSEKHAVLQVRRFAKYYGRALPHRAEFCDAVNHCENLADFKTLCVKYFTTTAFH